MPSALFAILADSLGGAERVIATAAAELATRPEWTVEILSVARRTGPGVLDQIDAPVTLTHGRRGDDIPALAVALRQISRTRHDLVFSSHFRMNAALSFARRFGWLRTRRLVTRESTVFADRTMGARLAAYRALYALYGTQDEIWVQTPYMADRLGEMIGPQMQARVQVIPNPVDCRMVRRAAAESLAPSLAHALAERPYVVWCGRFIPIKNPALAVEAFAVARRASGEDFGLVMVGTGPELEAVRTLVSDLGLQNSVLFTGGLTNPYPVLALARLGLLTSVREGFPNVLLEMMAAGTPHIVTTACAGDLESLTGIEVVQPGSAAALGESLAWAAVARSDRRPLYETALGIRSPARFVDALVKTL